MSVISRIATVTNQILSRANLRISKIEGGSNKKSILSDVGDFISQNASELELNSVGKLFSASAEFVKKGLKPKGQLLQDLWVVSEHGTSSGFFLDIGAGHPVNISNTYNLQAYFGWSGVIVEPNPEFSHLHKRLRTSTSVEIFSLGLTPESSESMNYIDDGEFSGNPKYYPGDIHSKNEKLRKSKKTITVPSKGIKDFISERNIQKIDYLSIDIEGGELDLIKAFPFNECKVHLVTIEHNFREQDQREIDHVLISNSFRRMLRDQTEWDGFYVNERW
jgi:FkbM family methyltransferase